MKKIRFCAIAMLLLTAVATHADDAQTVRKLGWYAGIPVQMNVRVPGPTTSADDKRPDVMVYVTAQTMSQPAQQAIVVTAPTGLKSLPAHDDVLTRMTTGNAPADAMGYFVVPGPKADNSNVRSQPDVPNSWPGAPLVREIFVGTDWVKLNNHIVIEYGLAMGWLTLREFGYGGAISSRYLDEHSHFDARLESEPPTRQPK